MRSLSTSHNRLLLLGLAIAGFAEMSYAVDPNRAVSQYVRNRWTSEQGFPGGRVNSISQTMDGYLWIGTDAGMVRFDGLKFQLIQDSGLEGISLNHVRELSADKLGNLWVRMELPTLMRYRDGAFHNVMADLWQPEAFVTAMTRATNGEVLTASRKWGAAVFHGGKFETLASAALLPRSPVICIAAASDGDIWLGTREAGLVRLQGEKLSVITQGLPDLKVNTLQPGHDGEMWVGTDNGIVRWDGRQLSDRDVPPALRRVGATAMAMDRDSNLWIGSDAGGLFRLNQRGLSKLDPLDQHSKETLTAIFEDREGNLWTGSESGIERIRESVFVTYSMPEGLASQNNGPIYVDPKGRTWSAAADGGLYWLQEGKLGKITLAGLSQDVIYSIAGHGDDLWIGRQRGGLTHLHEQGRTFAATTYTEAEGLAQNGVYAVHESRDGTVWAGTLNHGVSRFRAGRFTTFTTSDGLASDIVTAIAEGSNGTMWFGTANGVSALSQDRWHTYGVQNGLPLENVHCLLEDSAGVLWIGTLRGLAFLRSGIVTGVTDAGPVSREQIFGLAEDKAGFLWIATSNHILRVPRDSLLRGGTGAEEVHEYGPEDGLRGTGGVRRQRSVVTDSLGRIWFSLNAGLSVVDPARLTARSIPTLVHIQEITADGNAIAVTAHVRIPAGHQRISIAYRALNLASPERTLFRYKLDGFDHGWSTPIAETEWSYTNLGPGPYQFRVIASNSEGVFNSAEAVVAFDVEYALWQRSSFQFAVVVACGLSILGLYRFRVAQMARQLDLRFQERLAERTRIAQELHDTLLQGFLSASMQLDVVTDQLPEGSSVKPSLGRILALMRQVVAEGRDAVQHLRLTNSGSLDLEKAFSRIEDELTVDEDVGFRVIVQGHPRQLRPILRDEVYRIGREAVVNAFRHSRAKNIEVELEYARRQFRILVRDDGCGIESDVLRFGREGHWGLAGMRERAERIGAKLRLWSRVANGTEIELSVPNHIAFQKVSANLTLPRFLRWHSRRYTREE